MDTGSRILLSRYLSPLVCVPRILICIYYHHLLLAFYKAIYLFVQNEYFRESRGAAALAASVMELKLRAARE